MVTVKVPVAAVRLAVSVKVLVPVVLVGLKDPVTPLGRPDAVRLTLLAKPFSGFIYSDGARAAGSLSDAYSAGHSRKRVIPRRVHSQADRGLTGDVARSTDNGNREHSDGRSGASAER